jgi:hypothetical protein
MSLSTEVTEHGCYRGWVRSVGGFGAVAAGTETAHHGTEGDLPVAVGVVPRASRHRLNSTIAGIPQTRSTCLLRNSPPIVAQQQKRNP